MWNIADAGKCDGSLGRSPSRHGIFVYRIGNKVNCQGEEGQACIGGFRRDELCDHQENQRVNTRRKCHQEDTIEVHDQGLQVIPVSGFIFFSPSYIQLDR